MLFRSVHEELHFRGAGDATRERTELVEHPVWAVDSGQDSHGLWAAFEVDGVQQRLRWIPPGTFLMGSPTTEAGRRREEGPQHEVTLTQGYWLGETPVTQALWVAMMGENPSSFRGEFSEELRRPVEQVSWEDCRAFCERVNTRIAGLGARLPTEAEWECACRAGTTAATWTSDLPGEENARELDSIAWHRGNSGGRTHPVGDLAANAYGLYDMLGNVWEWCADDMREYTAAPVTDPVGDERTIRGGSWDDIAREVRAAYRDADSAARRDDYLGFRLAGGRAHMLSTSSEERATAQKEPTGAVISAVAAVGTIAPAGYAKLVVVSSICAGEEFELSRPQMSIGRANDNDIVINHRSISRNHAELVRKPETGRYTIVGLHASSDVRINGVDFSRIRLPDRVIDFGEIELGRGDVIDLGRVRLRFVEAGEDFVFARDAVITDVPEVAGRRGMLVALIAAIVALVAVGAVYWFRNS